MSDSDDSTVQRNFLTFQNENTTVWAKGPNITNMTGLSFRNNILTSTMQIPSNIERSRFMEPNFDQRSAYSRREISPMSNFDHRSAYYRRQTSPMSYIDRRSAYNRRELSPMSMYGGGDARARNFNNSYYPRDSVRTASSRRSVFNGRSGSPLSARSTDSNVSASARYIAMAFKNMQFNKYDKRLIKDAYSKYMNNKIKNKIRKRRNLRHFMKSTREQESDSSLSSDDERSSKGSVYNEYMSSCRSTNTDIVDFRRTITDSNMYKDCSNNLRRNTFKNMFNIVPQSVNNNSSKPVNKLHNVAPQMQRERLKNGFLLPSQRFNKSNAILPILEANECAPPNKKVKRREIVTNEPPRNCRHETDSEQDEIFSEVTVRETDMHNKESEHKRSINSEDSIYLPDKKKHKLSSPVKTNDRIKKPLLIQTKLNTDDKENGNVNTFEFVKPSLPLKKSMNKTKEKLISKSAKPIMEPVQYVQNSAQGKTSQIIDDDLEKSIDEPSQVNSISDLSMRPSFIKRKLFTQKLDVTEKQNNSRVNSSLNSPQANIYSAIQNEKHKARKLATSQSCLNRDIREGNNLLDLIHKIVPPDQMSVTNQMNKTETTYHKNKSEDNDDKWDVTSIISTCNNDNISETYTDEEIFSDNKKANDIPNKQQKPASNKDNATIVRNSNLRKLPDNQTNKIQKIQTENGPKKNTQNYVKSFWDIDSESGDEETAASKNLSHVREDQRKCNLSYMEITKNQDKRKPEPRNNLTINYKVLPQDSYKTLNNTQRILSHRSPKKKKSLVLVQKDKATVVDPPNKNNKSSQKLKSVPNKTKAPIKNVNVCNKNDTSKNSSINRPLRTCRLNKSQNEIMNCSSRLQIVLTPVKIINMKSKNNIKNVTDFKTENTKHVSKNTNPLVSKDVHERKCQNLEKCNEVKTRKSDVSFSLISNKISDKKNTARNKSSISRNNSSNMSIESKKSFSMTLRSSSKSPAQKVVANKNLRSKDSTYKNKM